MTYPPPPPAQRRPLPPGQHPPAEPSAFKIESQRVGGPPRYPEPQYPPPQFDPPSKNRQLWFVPFVGIAVILGGCVAFVGIVANAADEISEEITESAEKEAAENTQADATETIAADPDPAAAVAGDAAFGDGTFLVGDDIEPGVYRASGGASCYWERVAGLSGELDDILANGNTEFPIVEIRSDDLGFTSAECGGWRPVGETHPAAPATFFDEGMFVVGADIAPGTYRAESPGEFCYWERLNGFAGDLDNIKALKIAGEGAVLVEIEPDDVGFNSNGCGTWSQAG